MALDSTVALAFLLGALPICLWAGYTDLSRMRIPNMSVVALLAVFAVGGLLLLPLEGWTLADWAWRWPQFLAVLAIGMILNAVWLLGAGDAKFAAAAAPFVSLSDWPDLLLILTASMLVCWMLHRLAMVTVGRRFAPDWVSWSSGQRFPMAVVFGTTLIGYLAAAAAA